MPCQCCAIGLTEVFGGRVARREAKRFRKKGLTVRSRRLLDAIESTIQLDDLTSLEVGAGIGGLTITMLEHGVTKAFIVDAVPAYVFLARELAQEAGVSDSLEIELADYVVRAPDLAAVDLVVMDRVVCCYPEWPDLLAAAAGQATRVIALSYPRDALWVRFGIALINAVQRLRRQAFRVYVHPPPAMHRLLADRGFEPRVVTRRGVWDIAIAVRRSRPEPR